jgi:glutaredoxin 3
MEKKVTVYSLPTCPYCAGLKKLLNENNIKFKDIDVSENPGKVKEMKELTGQMQVPVIIIDGEAIVGFDKAKIQEKLGIG